MQEEIFQTQSSSDLTSTSAASTQDPIIGLHLFSQSFLLRVRPSDKCILVGHAGTVFAALFDVIAMATLLGTLIDSVANTRYCLHGSNSIQTFLPYCLSRRWTAPFRHVMKGLPWAICFMVKMQSPLVSATDKSIDACDWEDNGISTFVFKMITRQSRRRRDRSDHVTERPSGTGS